MFLRSLFIIGGLALLSSCGAEQSSTPTTAGTITFSGTGTGDLFTGVTFSPAVGGFGSSRNLASNPNDVAFAWSHFGTGGNESGSGSQTTIRYSTSTNSPSPTTYNLYVSSYGNFTTVVEAVWEINSNTPISGLSYDSAAKQITFTNVSVDGYANINASKLIPSNIILNGVLNHL